MTTTNTKPDAIRCGDLLEIRLLAGISPAKPLDGWILVEVHVIREGRHLVSGNGQPKGWITLSDYEVRNASRP